MILRIVSKVVHQLGHQKMKLLITKKLYNREDIKIVYNCAILREMNAQVARFFL